MKRDTKTNAKNLALTLIPLIALAGCGDGGKNSTPDITDDGGKTDNGSTDATRDSDNDGLTDLQEITLYKTNPGVQDTDGDGYDDHEEIVIKSFDKNINNFQFNPRIADTPRLEMEITSAPDLAMIYTEGSSTRKSIGTERSSSTSSANTRAWGGSQSHSIEMTHTASAEVSVGYESGGLSANVTLGYEFSHSTTNERSTNWSQEQQTENSNALTAIENREEESSVNVEGGRIATTITIRNSGDIAYRLKDLTLSSYMANRADPSRVLPVGNLTYSGSGSIDFPALTLSPGEKTPPLNFSGNVDLETIKAVLANSSNLVIAPVAGSLEGDNDLNFELASTNINSRTAQVIIDYGIESPVETYRVATVTDQKNPGIKARDVFADILQIPVTTGTSEWIDGPSGAPVQSHQGIIKVRNKEMSSRQNSYWIAAHSYSRDNGATKVTDYHNLILDGYDFDNIVLQKGHVLHLVYVQDDDRDGLGNRAEFLYGTDPKKADTDGDGLTDMQEVTGWEITHLGNLIRVYSNPLVTDTDRDRISDFDEWRAKTHPSAKNNQAPAIHSITHSHDGLDVELTVNVSDIDGNLDRLVVSWGDGKESTINDVSAGNIKIKYSYASLGSFNVQAIAYDSDDEASTPKTLTLYAGIPTDMLLLNLGFDGNYRSSVGGTLSLYGKEGYTADRFGFAGKAIDFNANGGESNLFPLLRSPHTGFSQDFTLALWLKTAGFNGNGVRIAGQGNWFNLYSTGNDIRFGILDGTTPRAGAPVVAYNSLPGNGWELYVVTANYDTVSRKSRLSLYRNALLVSTLEVDGVLSNPGSCLFYIGSHTRGNPCNDSRSEEFSGVNAQIDDLRLYGRALTSGEIKSLYADKPN